jgi:hypothetical protein
MMIARIAIPSFAQNAGGIFWSLSSVVAAAKYASGMPIFVAVL